VETPARLSGRGTLVSSWTWRNCANPPSGDYSWITEFLGAFAIAQPPHRRDHFLWLGVDIIEFDSGWFILALEDYHQFKWALELVDGEWAQVAEWHERFLRYPLWHIEPRSLCLVFESAGYAMYISLNYQHDNRLDHSYSLIFEDNLSVTSLVRIHLLCSLICRLKHFFTGNSVRAVCQGWALPLHEG
jgi:hypothetical protein